MKGNFKILIFLFSIILNIVFVGTYAVYKFQIIPGERKDGNLMKPLYLELNLSAQQLTKFKSERDKFHPHLQALEQEIKRKQIELIEILSINTPDPQALESKQKEIHELQAAAQDRVIAHLLQASTLLSPEQRTRFFRLIRERIEASISSCPPWTKPLEKNHQEN
ncbi:MAG: periplasmic heavy metal sensor [Deltaproteobacteria bacterium]|nr:periplasmic heavy metal sensor [Deltaproteobacteria bacterium]